MTQLIKDLHEIGDTVFLKTDPPVLDFTNFKQEKALLIYGSKKTIKIPLHSERMTTPYAVGLLNESVFQKGKTIVSWNIKSLFSYLFKDKSLDAQASILDLHVIESFMQMESKPPLSFKEALSRAKVVMAEKAKWIKIYSKIHLPLITSTIPSIENTPILDLSDRQKKYSHYQIEGQINGRIKATGLFNMGFNAHGMGPKQRESFRPVGEDMLFLHLDFKNMEPCTLQWISGDVNLKKALESKLDFYEIISYVLTGKRDHQLGKILFVPVVYGQTAGSLAKMLKSSQELAESYINTLHDKFPTAMDYLQSKIKSNKACDVLGRCRTYDPDDLRMGRKIRNFLVQAPSAMVCLEKLNDLNTKFPVAIHVHDGFYLCVKRKHYKEIAIKSQKILEAPSKILDGLQLKVSCKVGPSLNEMKNVNDYEKEKV